LNGRKRRNASMRGTEDGLTENHRLRTGFLKERSFVLGYSTFWANN
jgi:hypothetical protein